MAVEDRLPAVRRMLEEHAPSLGARVVPLQEGLSNASVVVVSGMDADVAGLETRVTAAPVIDASGKSPKAVLGEVAERLGVQGEEAAGD